jgi:deoxyribodipyrimidine photo-lyase
VRKVSNKCEFAAKTIRTKIHAQVSEYLTEFPAVQVMNESLARSHRWISPDISASRSLDSNGTSNHPECFGNLDIWESIMEHIQEVDRSVPEVTWLESGEHAAMESLKEFLGIHLDGYSSSNRHTSRLDTFATNRNDPTIANGCSGLSPYLHFGQLSSQRICLEVQSFSFPLLLE